jgi:hypothetical protein
MKGGQSSFSACAALANCKGSLQALLKRFGFSWQIL